MATDALIKTHTRNPSETDDKVRTTWIAAVSRSIGLSEFPMLPTNASSEPTRSIPTPARLSPISIGTFFSAQPKATVFYVMNAMSADDIRVRALAANKYRYPPHTEVEIEREISKIVEFRLHREIADAKTGYDAASIATEEAYDRRWTAQSELLLTPAPDLEAVQFKLEQLFDDDSLADSDLIPSWRREYTDVLIADVRRLNQQQKGA